MKNILICGFGNIGHYLFDELNKEADIEYCIDTYDIIPLPNCKTLEEIRIKQYEIVFITVPTDLKPNNELDISNIIDVLNIGINTKTICIKSTVNIGDMEKYFIPNYPKYDFVFSPEYYGPSKDALKAPNFIVLAGPDRATAKIADLYHSRKTRDFKIAYTEYKIAETAKFMENTFLAYKVAFCDTFYELSKALGFDYNKLREIFVLDERMGTSHTFVNGDHPYWNSHCLNKDVPACLTTMQANNINCRAISGMIDDNVIRKAKNYEHK